MGPHTQQVLLVDSNGDEVDVDSLAEELRRQSNRVLADDEVGLVLYVGDIGLYNLKPTESGEFLAQRVCEVSKPRFLTRVLRKQIGATVLSVTADAVFIIKDGQSVRKVRAEHLEPGMVLTSGEKVYR